MPTVIERYSPVTINSPPKKGRAFGAKNKASESIRWGYVEAYRQLGGVDGLIKWGRRKPDLFYPLLTKLLPHELAESGHGSPIRVVVYGASEQIPSHLSPITIEAASAQELQAEPQASDSLNGNTT